MPDSTQGEMSSVGASFATHVQEFHRSLPPEEQTLLEQVFELAAAAAARDDVQGFSQSGGGMTAAVQAFVSAVSGSRSGGRAGQGGMGGSGTSAGGRVSS